MKRCPQCGITKNFDSYSIRKSGKLYGWCKTCSVKKSQARYANPVVKEAKKEYDKQRHARNPELASIHRLAREARNPGIRSREAVRWNKSNPSRRRAIALAYKSRRRSTERDGMSGPEFRAWLDGQVKQCYWCAVDCADHYHVDHVMPLSKGGRHEAYNLVVACQPCNQRKSAKHPLQWLAELGYAP